METSRNLINDEDFKVRHRDKDTAFTRLRILTFSVVMILIIQKSLKSLQLILNEFALDFDINPVTASAFTDDFKDIYAMRWGVEGFYGILKTRF